MEVDLWGGRGLTGGSADRPEAPHETLPDAYSALVYLAQHPSIDADKIALMGFSWGGVVSMLTATNAIDSAFNLPFRFAAHIAHYPVCYAYNQIPGFDFSNLTGAPVLIQTAELDDYDFPGACELMVSQIPESDQQVVTVIEYPDVYHTWDRLEPKLIVEDPASHVGQGGLVTLSPDLETAKKSRRKAVKFLQATFDK
ncbi:MAG: dienelactone hydrolase family protein [Gammaproteobacteria bacterium]|nr:dienelactone hydrolase family protein [Gammaproteobacteria bacterium]